MFIKSISIKNLKAFSNEVFLDFNPNANGIKTDIENGNFIKIKNSFFSPIISISGANSSGKTSLLEILESFKLYLSPLKINNNDIQEVISLALNQKKQVNSLKTFIPNINTNSLFDIAEQANKIVKKAIGNVSPLSFMIYAEETFYELVQKEINNHTSKQFKEILNSKIIYKIISSKYSSVINEWFDSKHFKNDESFIKLVLFDEETEQDVFVKLADNSNLLILSVKNHEDKDLLDKKILQRILDFIVNITFQYEFESSFHNNIFSTRNKNFLSIYRSNIILATIEKLMNYLKISEEEAIDKVLLLLSIADKSIVNIEFINNKNKLKSGIKQIALIDGSTVSLDKLSKGTTRFIDVFFFIIFHIDIKRDVVLLIDEFDSLMHVGLVNFIKDIIFKLNSLSTKRIQLIFTSHNYDCVVDKLSPKQIFFIEENDGIKTFKKVSSCINKNNSVINMFKKQIIGSHPYSSDIDEMLYSILKWENND